MTINYIGAFLLIFIGLAIIVLKKNLIKIVIGMLFGLIIDLTSKKKKIDIENVCTQDECHCENGIIKSSIHHTINIGAFILITTLLLNLGIH